MASFKLTKDQAQQLAASVRALADQADTLTEAYEKLRHAIDTYNAAIEAYNATLDEARGFTTDQASEWRGMFEEKSEKWQDSDKGQAVDDLIQAWENAELDDLETIEEFDIEGPTDATAAHVQALDDLEG